MLDDKAERGAPPRAPIDVQEGRGDAGNDARERLDGATAAPRADERRPQPLARDGDHTRVVATLASAAAEIRGLSVGACALVRIPSTFPQQFICIGTSDQIERLLLQPD